MNKLFLTDADFATAIKTDHLTSIVGSGTQTLEKACISTQTEIESYLRGKYDLNKLFPVITAWNIAIEYPIDAIVYDVATLSFYTANEIVPASTPIDDAKWTKGDPRDALIVEFMIDLTLYRVHSRVAPNQVPETRIQRRDDAIDFLKRVAKYDITVGWALEVDTRAGSVNWGSNEKQSKIY